MRTLTRASWAVAVGAVVAATLAGPGTASAANRPVAHLLPASVRADLARVPALSASQLQAARAREAVMAARDRRAPRFDASRSAVTSFTVDTTVDSPLARSGSRTCADAQVPARCSLRAAVAAANNRRTPVSVTLPAGTYDLTTGAALGVTDPGGLSITGAGAAHTTIRGDGSGIFIESGGNGAPAPALFLTHLRLTRGDYYEGGALSMTDSSSGSVAVLTDVVLTDNTATDNGGAIDAAYEDTLYLTHCTVSGNHATYGAGLAEEWSYVNLVDDTVTSNATSSGGSGYGGGIETSYGVVHVVGGTISDNTAGTTSYAGGGGGIYDNEAADITLTGTTVDGNAALDGGTGGGIFAGSDYLDVTGGSISHNTTGSSGSGGGSGGGLTVGESGQVSLRRVTMTDDTLGGPPGFAVGGGAIYAYTIGGAETVTLDRTVITGANDSAVYLFGVVGAPTFTMTDSTISGNSDVGSNASFDSDPGSLIGCGGALCAVGLEGGTFTLDLARDTLVGNSSNGPSGASGVDVLPGVAGGAALDLDRDTFRGNVAHGPNSAGAVSLATDSGDTSTSSSLVVDGSTFLHNRTGSSGVGGAVSVFSSEAPSPTTVTFAGDHFSSNAVGKAGAADPSTGGAVAVRGDATLRDTGSSFTSNLALGTDAAGGAVYDVAQGASRWDGTVFRGNVASGSGSDGGAFYANNNAGAVFDGATLSGNVANQGGGAYLAGQGFQLEVVDSTVANNVARAYGRDEPGLGGGVYAGNTVFLSSNSTFAGNKARSAGSHPGEGGAIYESGSAASLAYSTVAENVAAKGAGIYAAGPGGTLLGSIVAANHGPNCSKSDAWAVLTSLGENVLGSSRCVVALRASDRASNHPRLGSLKFNGGATKTMALGARSPAIDLGGYDCPATDQRGVARTALHCDAGAYQRVFR